MKKKIYSIWLIFLHALFYVFRIFPIDNEKIVFSSYVGKGFGDNPKYIALSLHKTSPKIKMVWIAKEQDNFPSWIKHVRLNSIASVFELATAKIWVDNARKPRYVVKRKKQFYIQTWHGGLSLKKVEDDTEVPLPKSWIETSKHDSKLIDVMISNSMFCTNMYRRAFWYSGKILEYGSPRNDLFFNIKAEEKTRIRRCIGVDEGSVFILYAPTFRTGKKDVYDLNVQDVKSAISQRENKSVQFAVRMHPLMKCEDYKICSTPDIINLTDYPDMYELLAIADILITDYSSSMFEMHLMGKEVHLYVTDLKEYCSDRGLYFNIENLPYCISKSNSELIENIIRFDKARYNERLAVFNTEIGLIENGSASCKTAKLILDKMSLNVEES